ncbi:hypothetical protein BHE90_016791 [Fusarium euwallaceae]|uniref:Uncharacterized protein n=1 Tax=Fusarium euwallaceae TaxID=1147111 RepID=A0A430KZD9_9HYPO|nr:hypothetical protein BHE90_016791 [Fusarium euwallaceae]
MQGSEEHLSVVTDSIRSVPLPGEETTSIPTGSALKLRPKRQADMVVVLDFVIYEAESHEAAKRADIIRFAAKRGGENAIPIGLVSLYDDIHTRPTLWLVLPGN